MGRFIHYESVVRRETTNFGFASLSHSSCTYKILPHCYRSEGITLAAGAAAG